MKHFVIIAIIGMIATSGLVLSASAYDIENMWSSYYYSDNNGNEHAYIWNPTNQTISNVDQDKEFEIQHVGNWDVISEPDGFNRYEYIIQNEQSNFIAGETLPVLIWLDNQVLDNQERIDLLEHELATQIMRTITLEKKLTELQLQLVNQNQKISELEQKLGS